MRGLLPSQREPLIGSFVGNYLIIGRLGQGGFGRVLLGLLRPLYRLEAAVELIEIEGQDARTTLQAIEHEAGALAVLQHPHIARLLHYGEFQGRAFMAMELIRGARTLQSEIERMGLSHRGLEMAAIRHLLVQILDGLEAAHAQDIIHRGLAPENIMLQDVDGAPWHVKLVGFGVAKVIAARRDTIPIPGPVHCMAPEQIEAKRLGVWTDLYAVGVIAFALLTGRWPFSGKDMQAIFRQKSNATHDVCEGVVDRPLPEPVVAFLRKALACSPEARFRSAQDMRAALGAAFDALVSSQAELSNDLTGLLDPEDVARIQQERAALEHERAAHDELRQMLELEKKALQSEIERLASLRIEVLSADDETVRPALAGMGDTQAPQTGACPSSVPPARRIWPWVMGFIVLGAAVIAGFFMTREVRRADDVEGAPATTVDPPSVESTMGDR